MTVYGETGLFLNVDALLIALANCKLVLLLNYYDCPPLIYKVLAKILAFSVSVIALDFVSGYVISVDVLVHKLCSLQNPVGGIGSSVDFGCKIFTISASFISFCRLGR